MGKKCPEADCPKCLPGWLAAFGDLMSLLLCFFVLLLSMATMDAKKIEEAVGSLNGALSVLEGGVKSEISNNNNQATPVEMQNNETTEMVKTAQESVSEINEIMQDAKSGGQDASLEESQDGFIIKLPASLLFDEDSANITNEDAMLFLRRIALLIKNMPNEMKVNAQGHTDNTKPAISSNYNDNWELSTARGVSVVKELIKYGINADKLMASGKAGFEPISSNKTEQGRAKNSRVELRFFSSKKSQKKNAKSILDRIKQ